MWYNRGGVSTDLDLGYMTYWQTEHSNIRCLYKSYFLILSYGSFTQKESVHNLLHIVLEFHVDCRKLLLSDYALHANNNYRKFLRGHIMFYLAYIFNFDPPNLSRWSNNLRYITFVMLSVSFQSNFKINFPQSRLFRDLYKQKLYETQFL